MTARPQAICMLAPLSPSDDLRIPSPSQVLGPLLQARGHTVAYASYRSGRSSRVADMIATLRRGPDPGRGGRGFDVAILSIFGGASLLTGAAVLKAARHLGVPVIGVLHGGGLPGYRERRPGLVDHVLDQCARLVAPSAFLQRTFSTRSRRVDQISNPVSPPCAFKLRDPIRPRVLWMRSFHDLYRPDVAVRAFAGFALRRPDATMTMAGPDKGELRATKALAADLGVGHAISFPGMLVGDAKVRAFDDHDIFCSTNDIDNAPVTVVEASLAGLPIAATEVGGLADLLAHGEAGLLVPPGHGMAMCDALTRIVSDPASARQRVDAAVRLAQVATPERVATLWDDLLVELPHGSST